MTCTMCLLASASAADPAPKLAHRLDSLAGLRVLKSGADVGPDVVTRGGKKALRLTHVNPSAEAAASGTAPPLVILEGSDFTDGSLDVDVVGLPRAGAPPDVRGFVGLAFRVEGQGDRYEVIYLRQTNGRSENQLNRNHTTQYMSFPEYPWQRLREEEPGVYESYVDLEPGAWDHIHIVVSGTQAKLYVNGTSQPCLVVGDLKHGPSHGAVALWVGSDTEAYFANLQVRRQGER